MTVSVLSRVALWPSRRPTLKQRPPIRGAAVVWTLGAIVCSQSPRPLPEACANGPSAEPAIASGHSAFASRIEREPVAGGGERLSGSTQLEGPGRERITVREDVKLDPTGRLSLADVDVERWYAGHGSSQSLRVRLDAARGEVSLESEGRRRSRHAETDLPWAYIPLALEGGRAVSTPVAASVARRAAESSAMVRLVDAGGADVTIASDQLSVTDGSQQWVILGDDLATFVVRDERAELDSLQSAALGVLVRMPAEPAPSCLR